MAQLAVTVTPEAIEGGNITEESLNAINETNDKLRAQMDALKDDLMSAMAQLAITVTPEDAQSSAANEESLKVMEDMSDKLRADMDALKDDLMSAMAQLAITVTPEEAESGATGKESLKVMEDMSDKLRAEMDMLKDDLLNGMAQLSSSVYKSEERNSDGADSLKAVNEMGDKLRSEILDLKDDLMNAMAQLAVTVTPDNAKSDNTDRLEAAVERLNDKIDTQSTEVGGLKRDLLETVAKMAVSAPSVGTTSEFMALKQEISRSKDDNEALGKEYSLQLERAIDSMNVRMQSELDKLRSELLGAISGLDVKPAEESAEITENEALKEAYSEKLSAAVENLNTNLDTQVSALKEELLYAITQVGMAVFNADDLSKDLESVKDEIAKSSEAAEAAENGYLDRLDAIADDLNERIEAQMTGLKEEMLNALSVMDTNGAEAAEGEERETAEIDYELLAERLAEKVPAIDYDELCDRLRDILPEAISKKCFRRRRTLRNRLRSACGKDRHHHSRSGL